VIKLPTVIVKKSKLIAHDDETKSHHSGMDEGKVFNNISEYED